MKRKLWAIGLAGILGITLVGCSARTSAKRDVNLGAIASNDLSLATIQTQQSLPAPPVASVQTATRKPAATSNLTPPNVPPVGTVGVGDRPDPFAALPMSAVTITRKPTIAIATATATTTATATATPNQSSNPANVAPALIVPPAPPEIMTAPTVVIPANPTSNGVIASGQQAGGNANQNQNRNAIENPQQNSNGITSNMPPAIAATPPLSLAEAIEITGVINTGDKPRIIVQVPNERSSRAVSVGDVLANGQVRVRRVIMNAGSDPYVVLEQNGKEVMRSIGGS